MSGWLNCVQYGETFSMYMFGRYITIVGRSEIRNVMRAPDDQFNFNEAVMDVSACTRY
jgi:hypothetical protein